MSDQRNPAPFHAGEIAVQTRMGVAQRAAVMGGRLIRPNMIDQHREFFAELPFIVLGTLDTDGNPWASILTGQPGFLSTPDDTTLMINALPNDADPFARNLKAGADIGVLGVQLETRRRNRMNGRIGDVTEDGFSISVLQSFGNCPKFIQTRDVTLLPTATPVVHSTDHIDAQTAQMLATADTLFIATAWRDAGDPTNQGTPNQGADVSHRGGKPGFVKVVDDHSFTFPDFSGNNIFNTLGNLELNPRAGILFPDFTTGDLVTLTGTTQITWDGPEVQAFEGAQRLITFHADQVHRIEGGLGLRAPLNAYSPFLQKTGAWSPTNPVAA